MESIVVIPLLILRRPIPGKAKELVQGHLVTEQQSWNLASGPLALLAAMLPTQRTEEKSFPKIRSRECALIIL